MSIKAETSFSLKDDLFNARSVAVLGEALARAHSGFDRRRFERDVLRAFPDLELKARIQCMVEHAHRQMPADIEAARDIWMAALPEPLDPNLSDDDFGQFIWAVPGEYIARYGCNSAVLAGSLDFLREATMRFTSESAIRPFLQHFPEATLEFVHQCAVDDNYHVRRLASEGIRPYLPWATRVVLPVEDIVAVLDKLHADNTRYVTRSVANNLNDLSRIEPAAVLATLGRWQREALQQSAELDWMVRHALRTLLKNDDEAALAMVGYPSDPAFKLRDLDVSDAVRVGESLSWRVTLISARAQKLKIALKVGFLKANGRHSAKVFKVKDVQTEAGEKLALEKKVALRPMTTRVLYPGEHYVEVVVNGVTRGRRVFMLKN